MIFPHLISITFAFIIDKIIGDPPDWPHPVKWMGTLIHHLDTRLNNGTYKRGKGIIMLAIVLFIVLALSFLLIALSYSIHPFMGIAIESILIWTTIAEKSLREAGFSVYQPLLAGELVEARHKLSYIVGRDTDKLDEQGVVRATVETVAENTSDGVTVPLFWALIGGAPLAMLYRAVNTCDSMVGYRNQKYEDFGWASARLDDVMNWVPSRLTSFCMLVSNHPENNTYGNVLRTVFRDANKHLSPNSGWGEAAVAAILGIQLGGVNYYKGIISNRAKMGEPTVVIDKSHILKANRILSRTAFTFLLFLWIGGMLIEMAISRS